MSRKVHPNILDRVIAYVDPIASVRRRHVRAAMAIAGGYLGAKRKRRATKEWRPTHNSGDDLLPAARGDSGGPR